MSILSRETSYSMLQKPEFSSCCCEILILVEDFLFIDGLLTFACFFFLFLKLSRDVREKPFMLHYEVCCSLISGG